ncbi:hypothetical protein HK102_012664, partial [Quaeritorhiza haematococci]
MYREAASGRVGSGAERGRLRNDERDGGLVRRDAGEGEQRGGEVVGTVARLEPPPNLDLYVDVVEALAGWARKEGSFEGLRKAEEVFKEMVEVFGLFTPRGVWYADGRHSDVDFVREPAHVDGDESHESGSAAVLEDGDSNTDISKHLDPNNATTALNEAEDSEFPPIDPTLHSTLTRNTALHYQTLNALCWAHAHLHNLDTAHAWLDAIVVLGYRPHIKLVNRLIQAQTDMIGASSQRGSFAPEDVKVVDESDLVGWDQGDSFVYTLMDALLSPSTTDTHSPTSLALPRNPKLAALTLYHHLQTTFSLTPDTFTFNRLLKVHRIKPGTNRKVFEGL